MRILNINKSGFTLIEIIIVIAIVGIIIAFGANIDLSNLKADTFRVEESTLVAILESARSRAMANMFESEYGVCYIEPNYIIFRGSCAPGATTNELFSANKEVATLSDFSSTFPIILFSQLSGSSTSATIHLTDGIKSADIVINNEGRINW